MINQLGQILVKAGGTKDRSETPQLQIGTDSDHVALWGGSPLRTVPTINDSNCKYFDKTGTDAPGFGTQANPYLTLKYAIEQANVSSFNYVCCQDSGTYQETEIVQSDIDITILSLQNQNPTIKLDAFSQNLKSNYATSTTVHSEIGQLRVLASNANYYYDYNNLVFGFNSMAFTMGFCVGFKGDIYTLYNNNLYVSAGGTGSPTVSRSNSFGIATDGETLVTLDRSTNVVYTSPDGSTWTAQGTLPHSAITITNILYYDSTLYYHRAGTLHYSTDLGVNVNTIGSYGLMGVGDKYSLRVLDDEVYFYSADKLYKINADKTVSEVITLKIYDIEYYNNYYYICEQDTNSIKRYDMDFNYIDTIITETNPLVSIAIIDNVLFYSEEVTFGSNYDVKEVLLCPLAINNINHHTTRIENYAFDANNKGAAFWLYAGVNQVFYSNIYNQLHYSYMTTTLPTANDIRWSIIRNSKSGLNIIRNGVLKYDLLYNIEKDCINLNENVLYATLENCTFYNVSKAIYNISSTIPNFYKNNIIQDCIGRFIEDTATLANYGTVEYTIYNTELGNVINDTSTTLVRRAEFRDIENEDFRLKVEEALASNGEYYTLESPAKSFGDDGYDAGCYKVSYTSSDTDFDRFIHMDYNPETMQIGYINKRYSEQEDMSGDIHRIHASQRPVITLSWPDNTHQDYQHFYDVLDLIGEDRPVQVWFNEPFGLESGSGTFNADNLTLIDPSAEYAYNRWRGLWVEIDISGTKYYYFIDGSVGDLLTLQDLKEYGLTGSNSVDYVVRYMNAVVKMNELGATQKMWGGFANIPNRIGFQNYELIIEGVYRNR